MVQPENPRAGRLCCPLKLLVAMCWQIMLAVSVCAAASTAEERVPVSAAAAGCDVGPPVPSIPANAKTFKRAGGPDDAAAIQSALDDLRPGDWLVFPPDTYTTSKRLTVSVEKVTLYGKGATIEATNPTDGALLVSADDVSVYDFTLIQNSTTRQSTPWAGGIAVYQSNHNGAPRVRGAVIQGNRVQGSAAAGIFIFRADGFTVAGNTVWRSLADGIHITAGSTSGRVIHNTVSQTGDDMIAVVSFTGNRSNEPAAVRYKDWSNILALLDKNIYIADNELADNYQGRGISVVGGADVTIENNAISRVPTAAGIYIERETSWMTLGDHNILIRGNTLTDIETVPPTYKPPEVVLKPTHHGAIEIGSFQLDDEKASPTYRDALSVSDIGIEDNVIQSWGYAPIRIGVGSGRVQNVEVKRNKFISGKSSGAVETHAGLENDSVVCEANQLGAVTSGSECAPGVRSAKLILTVTGASLRCSADGKLILDAIPKQPTHLQLH